MNSKLKPIPELDNLPEAKRDQLHQWIDEVGYHKAIEKVRSEFGVEVTYNKLYRYYQRVLQKDRLESCADDQLTMPDYVALLNGEPIPYDRAGIETVMKRAFDRSCARQVKTSELASLLRIFHYKTNCDWNNRRLAQNDKRIEISSRIAQLRSEEFEWKKSSNSNSALKNPKSAIQEDALGPFASDLEGVRRRARAKFGFRKEDALGPLARNLDDVERRVCAQFNLPYDPPNSSSRGDEAHEPTPPADSIIPMNAASSNSQPAPSNPQPNACPAPSPSTPPSRRRREESHESNPATAPLASDNQQPSTRKQQPKLPAPRSAPHASVSPHF